MSYHPLLPGAASFWDEGVAIIGTAVFLIILIRLVLLDGDHESAGRPGEGRDGK
jgi:hypothetical protein